MAEGSAWDGVSDGFWRLMEKLTALRLATVLFETLAR
jgi:hypothetical protein